MLGTFFYSYASCCAMEDDHKIGDYTHRSLIVVTALKIIVAPVIAVLKPVADLLHSFYYDNESYSSLPRNVLDS